MIDPQIEEAVGGLAGGTMTRRTVLAATTGAVGLTALSAISPTPAYAAAPVTADGVVALARSYLGDHLPTVRATTTAPWSGYSNSDWCAWFVSWCLRGLGNGYETWASNLYGFGQDVSTPAVGDIAIFPDYHTGIVSKIVSGTPWIVDGNGTTAYPSGTYLSPPLGTYVQERPSWTPRNFVRPDYTETEPTEGDMQMRVIFNTDNPTDATRRAVIGELTFDVINNAESQLERRLWGTVVNVSQAEWNTIVADINQRRALNGLGALTP